MNKQHGAKLLVTTSQADADGTPERSGKMMDNFRLFDALLHAESEDEIESILMAECFAHNIDPESPQAPQSMTEAVELFFKVRDGKIDNLGTDEQRKLAENINLVAVGSRTNPNYLIIDKGEG